MTKKILLISKEYSDDPIGQKVAPHEVAHEVFCDVSSISASEFARAGTIGLKASYMFRVWTREYHGEDIVDYNGQRYSVYRTYEPGNGRIELYVQEDVGI